MVVRGISDTELVEQVDRIEVPDGNGEGHNPHGQSTHQRQSSTVESGTRAEERKPAVLASRVEVPSCEDTSEKTRCDEGGGVGKEHVSRRLAFKVDRRLVSFVDLNDGGHSIDDGLGGQVTVSLGGGGHGDPDPNGSEGKRRHPFMAASHVQVGTNEHDDGKHQRGERINASEHVESLGADQGHDQHDEGNGGGGQIGHGFSNDAWRDGQHAGDGDDEHRHHVVRSQVVVNAHDPGGGKSEQHGQGCEQQPQRGTWLNRLRIHLFFHLYPSF